MKYILIAIPLFLVACGAKEPLLIKPEIKVVKPPESYYNCPTIKSFPNPDNLTDLQVAKLIVRLHKNNQICKNSIEGIRKFINEAEQSLKAEIL